jgi:fatty acid omega-hydroxylase
MAIKLPLQPWWVVTTKPENVRHILSKDANFKNYPKGHFFSVPMKELLGSGIFNADGEGWLYQRKTASRMFTAKVFKEHIWVVVERNAAKLRELLVAAEGGAPIDLFNFMNRFTLDTIGEVGFAKSIGSLDDPTSPFLGSFDRAQQICIWRFYNAAWPLMRRFGLGTERESDKHFGLLDTYSREVVRDLREATSSSSKDTKENAIARQSFVGLFLQDAQARGEEVSEDFLRDLVLNFLIAGRDTTAQALSWTVFCLTQHPDVEAKAREEILNQCGQESPTYEDIKANLPYLQAVLHEALRLYPSVPLIPKHALADDVLPDGTKITAGTVVGYNSYGMGRDPVIWGEDAEDFKPQRWLDMETSPDSYTFPAFHGGSRECLGRRLAIVEMKTCLAMMLPRFCLKLAVPPTTITSDTQLTLGMGRGLPVYVTAAKV